MSNYKYLFIFLFFLYLIVGFNCRAENELLSDNTNTVIDAEKIYRLIDTSVLYSDISISLAIETALSAKKLAVDLKNKETLAKSLENLAFIFFKDENFEEAMKYYSEALTLTMELNNQSETAGIYTSLGRIYRRQGNYEKAIESDLKAIEMYEELEDENLEKSNEENSKEK